MSVITMKRLLLALLVLTQPALAAEQALTECRQIEDVEERVACYDRFVDSRSPMKSDDVNSGDMSPDEAPEPASVAETTEPRVVPDAQSLFGTNDAEAKRIVEASLEIEQIDRIVATVTDVHQSTTRKLTVTLDNGQVWRQLDSRPMRLGAGEAVVIRKASLGSFLMEKQSGGRSIRVKRAD